MQSHLFQIIVRSGESDGYKDRVEKELREAGVTVVDFTEGEVVGKLMKGQQIIGVLKRRWGYYEFDGRVPLVIARGLYNNPLGRNDICIRGCALIAHPDSQCVVDSTGTPVIRHYQIRSSEGLGLFVEELRLHEIID